ncbi:unnamed protein product [Moneuplotes crassus]|uniref:Uncharacterized protein n=1 Tax=Euplotes crassus TaxID=5936 RepID=A0AAD1X6Z7_EUPCR|nr:unnamed protein product [Moneuplotes crassus]
MKTLSKVNDADKKNVNELSPPKERHVKSIENRPLSPFSQIKHDVEQFRSTFSCKVDAFLSKTKKPEKLNFSEISQKPLFIVNKVSPASRPKTKMKSPVLNNLMNHLKTKVAKIAKFEHSVFVPHSIDNSEEQIIEGNDVDLTKLNAKYISAKGFPHIIKKKRRTNNHLKPSFDKDRSSLDLQQKLLSMTALMKKKSQIQETIGPKSEVKEKIVIRSPQFEDRDSYFAPRITPSSNISAVKNLKVQSSSKFGSIYSSEVPMSKGSCISPNPRSFMSFEPISVNFTSPRGNLSKIKEDFSTPTDYYGSIGRPQKFLSPNNIRVKLYLDQKNETRETKLQSLFKIGSKKARNFRTRKRVCF